MNQNSTSPTVFIVDDDAAVLDSTSRLVESVGFKHEAYQSAVEFLENYQSDRSGCLVLDVRMARMSGLELQDELKRRGVQLPVIFISGHGDIPMAVEAMRKGAIDFIVKPFRSHTLLQRINQAIENDVRTRQQQRANEEAVARYSNLTAREKEIARLIVAGCSNKVIAQRLLLSPRTVESHRSHIMKKLQVSSIPELVQLIGRIVNSK
jgi:FixJ family two-component response regulator